MKLYPSNGFCAVTCRQRVEWGARGEWVVNWVEFLRWVWWVYWGVVHMSVWDGAALFVYETTELKLV